MVVSGAVTQPNSHSTLEIIETILGNGSVSQIDVAAAYVTTGGVQDLVSTMKKKLAAAWPVVRKRWLISFDYCRSDPLAVQMLVKTPNSCLRVHDADRVIRQDCTPTIPFHPKTFIFKSASRLAALAGSGNISRSGLKTGFEAGIFLEVKTPVVGLERSLLKSVKELQDWYDVIWREASPFSEELLRRYEEIFKSAEKLQHPASTEDDIISVKLNQRGTNSLAPKDLLKLRVCRHLWIEAGNITKNLGRGRPGNQLMMKRLSRVFFGVPATSVPQNSPLTRIEIFYDGVSKLDCSLTFSDNGMDKLTLPVPGSGGPPSYDNENLLFTELSAGVFNLQLGTSAQKALWLKSSKAIDASFLMSQNGRKWGVF